ncbi:MAG: BON domain-containing protein [Acidobacteriota bacterium]
MPREWRFWLVTAAMLAAVLLCAGLRAADIEQDLLVRAQRALAADGVPYYGLRIDGRDAVLGGPVESAEEGQRVRRVVADVRGIRMVQDALIVESFPEATTDATIRATRPPTLRIQRLGDRLFVRAHLPADDVADELHRHLRGFGGEVASSSLSVGDAVAEAAWMARLEELVALVAEFEGTGSLTVEGSTAVLSGLVADAATRDRIRERARAIEGLAWRFDLFSAGGSQGLPGDDA